ncbi:AbaSI family restriction endonuclease [Microbacterium sp. NPDC096154]|uniref:AbaSI family restriction endonuclease n=1 Tax=Microbacterium sp. NPDC096154 TaxID=3155549 RepID=UPI003316BE35
MPWVVDEELAWQAGRLSSITRKPYELWAVSRIVHRLDDPQIEWATQQLVRHADTGRISLLDLYFPQFRLAVEIDELGHRKTVELDRIREQRVIDDARVEFRRWRLAETRTLAEARQSIDALVDEVRERRRAQEAAGEFIPYVRGRSYDPDHWIALGKLSVDDDARFRRHVDVARLFGKQYKAHYRATIRLPPADMIWFPKLYPNADWHNSLLEDGTLILQRPADDVALGASPTPLPVGAPMDARIVTFAHYADEFGQVYYRFVGVFQQTAGTGRTVDYRRIADVIEFDGNGWFEISNRPPAGAR